MFMIYTRRHLLQWRKASRLMKLYPIKKSLGIFKIKCLVVLKRKNKKAKRERFCVV